jgi:hypothetical protein
MTLARFGYLRATFNVSIRPQRTSLNLVLRIKGDSAQLKYRALSERVGESIRSAISVCETKRSSSRRGPHGSACENDQLARGSLGHADHRRIRSPIVGSKWTIGACSHQGQLARVLLLHRETTTIQDGVCENGTFNEPSSRCGNNPTPLQAC